MKPTETLAFFPPCPVCTSLRAQANELMEAAKRMHSYCKVSLNVDGVDIEFRISVDCERCFNTGKMLSDTGKQTLELLNYDKKMKDSIAEREMKMRQDKEYAEKQTRASRKKPTVAPAAAAESARSGEAQESPSGCSVPPSGGSDASARPAD